MNILDAMQQVMRDVFANPGLVIKPPMSALDIDGWDSLSHTLLVLQLESEFGIELDLDAVSTCADVGNLADYITRLTQAHAGVPHVSAE